MIVASIPGQLRLVTQNDHASFAAELLGLWRCAPLSDHPRRSSLLRAVREHDNGWREADSAPHCRPDGRPHDFISLPEALRRELWQQGVERFVDDDPWVAALILEHALVLHRGRDDPAWHALLETWREQRASLLEEAGESEDTLARDYRFLDLCDMASLVVCCPLTESIERHGFSLRLVEPPPVGVDAVLILDPFPLAGATTFRIPCRTIPDRCYGGDGDLAIELAIARWQEMRVRVAPSDG